MVVCDAQPTLDLGELPAPIEVKKEKKAKKEKPLPFDPILDVTAGTQFGTYRYLEGAAGSRELATICKLLLERKSVVTCDLETSSLTPYGGEILLVAFSFDGISAYVFNPTLVEIAPFLEVLSSNPIANANIVFDYKFWKVKWGIEAHIYWDTMITHALALAGVVKFVGGNSLENMSARYLGVHLSKGTRDLFIKGVWHTNEAIRYAAEDVQATHRLIPVTSQLLEESGQEEVWEQFEKLLIPVIADMELAGIWIDPNKLATLRETLENELAKRREALAQISEKIDPNSHKNLIEYFTGQLGEKYLPRKRENGEWKISFDDERLSTLCYPGSTNIHPAAKAILDVREIEKLLSTYITPWGTEIDFTKKKSPGVLNPHTQRIHAGFNQIGAETGRLSSSGPNLQNVPRNDEFRNLFSARPGYKLISCDYSQIELRVLGELAQESLFIEAFSKRAGIRTCLQKELIARGEDLLTFEGKIEKKYPELKDLARTLELSDMHSQTAIKMFKLDTDTIKLDSKLFKEKRADSKTINFGVPYQRGAPAISLLIGRSINQTQKLLDEYFELHRQIDWWLANTKRVATTPISCLAEGLGLEEVVLSRTTTVGGRSRLYILPTNCEAWRLKTIRGEIERAGVNHPIQGLAADINKLALIYVHKALKEDFPNSRILMTVHDEIVVEAPEKDAVAVAHCVSAEMIKAGEVYLKDIPLEVSCAISDCWTK